MRFEMLTIGFLPAIVKEAIAGDSNYVETPPATSSSEGVKGQYSLDNEYAYFCVATNQWAVVPLVATWTK